MYVSARKCVKSSLCFIKGNFGKIWVMFLKLALSVIPFLLIMGLVLYSLIGLNAMMGAMHNTMPTPMAKIEGVVEPGYIAMAMTQFISKEDKVAMMAMVKEIHPVKLALSGAGILAAIGVMFLATSAMLVNMTQSIISGSPLQTRIFSSLWDKRVKHYTGVSALLILSMIAFAVLFIGGLGILGLSQGVLVVVALPLIVVVVISVLMRMVLIFPAMAMGDKSSFKDALKDAFLKTKGQMWNVFKVFVLAQLVILLFQVLVGGLEIGVVYLDSPGLAIVLSLVSLAITLPLSNLFMVSSAHLYKEIRA